MEVPPRARALQPDLSERLDDLIARSLAKAPDDRIATMSELADALADLGAGPAEAPARASGRMSRPGLAAIGLLPTLASTDRATPSAGTPLASTVATGFTRRRGTAPWALVGIALAIAIVGALAFAQCEHGRDRPTRTIEVTPASTPAVSPATPGPDAQPGADAAAPDAASARDAPAPADAAPSAPDARLRKPVRSPPDASMYDTP